MSLTYWTVVHMKTLISVYKRAVKVLCAASQMLPGRGHTSVDPLPLKQHLQYNKCILVHTVVHNKSACLRQLPHAGTRSSVNSRNSIFVLPKTGIDPYKLSFSYIGSYCYRVISKTHAQLVLSNIKCSSTSVGNVACDNRIVKHCISLYPCPVIF